MFAIIKEAGDPESSLQKLAQVVGREPAFTTQLLKVVNSPFFGHGKEVFSVQQATVAIGSRTVRNLAVAHAVRSTTEDLDLGDFDGVRFWEDSLRRATIARKVAEHVGHEDPLEAFTVGLIQDIGTLFLAYLCPEHSAELNGSRPKPGPARVRVERQLTGLGHPEAFAQTAHTWQLPDDLTEAIVGHHAADARCTSRRGQWLLAFARVSDAVADIFQAGATSELQQVAQGHLDQLPGESPLILEDLCDEIRQEMVGAAREFQIKVERQPTYAQMVAAANRSLININDDYEQITQRLEKLLREKEELTRQLQEKNKELHRLATTDTLTGVANRRHFTEVLVAAIAEAVESGQPISLIMADADHFKKVNDTYGHAVGDDVLKALAERMGEGARPVDTVGRLGGEEFAILLPGAGTSRAQIIAERIRQALRSTPIVARDGTSIRQTASFGGFTWNPRGPAPSPDQMLQAADAGCYDSKRAGRDRVTWRR